MASKVEICNLALSHLGVSKEISSITEKSQEAHACNRFYDTCLSATLRDYTWHFATKFSELALVTENPTNEWQFAYRYPTDCLKVRKVLSGTRIETEGTRVPFIESQDSSGLLIFTDQQDAIIEYTFQADDPVRYPPDFILALSFRLAFYIAPRVTSGDQFRLGDRAMSAYRNEIMVARLGSASESQKDIEPDSYFVRARS